jgi:hypothetical protein
MKRLLHRISVNLKAAGLILGIFLLYCLVFPAVRSAERLIQRARRQ